MIKTITDEMIDDVLRDSRTFIILFYSEKISNMSNITAIFDDFDKKFNGKIDIYKCAIDEETGKLTQYFNMNVLPAMIMMKNNRAYANVAGTVSAMVYEDAVKTGIIEIMKESKRISSSAFLNGYSTL